MTISEKLNEWLKSGVHRIGEIEILRDVHGAVFVLCHHEDAGLARSDGFGNLEVHSGPDAARDLSLLNDAGEYRFAKACQDLRRGWVMTLADIGELRRALDLFYPAALGLNAALEDGRLEIENLRDKLNRQTGMYRYARNISDAGAQRLVTEVCGPAHQCAKRILWRIDADTPLEDSEASRFPGIIGGISGNEALPMLCREACNHFVAECRRVSKEEATAKSP
jgi:sirohydrochlorin cobaltochelatase